MDLVKGDSWEIRALRGSDFVELHHTVQAVYSGSPFPIGGGWSEEQITEEGKAGSSLGVFYRPFGLTAFVIWRCFPGGREIRLLGTHPKWCRRGIMAELMRSVIEEVDSGEEIWLEVHEGNRGARNLYEKLGFSKVGRRPNYYRDGAGADLYSRLSP